MFYKLEPESAVGDFQWGTRERICVVLGGEEATPRRAQVVRCGNVETRKGVHGARRQ